MGSDRARVSYDPSRHWRGVINQQGRVTLEADWNEAAAIAAEDDRAQLVDVIGPAGTPDDGYRVTVGGSGDLTIQHGTMYVGGERMVLDTDLDYAHQPDWIDAVGDPLWVDPGVPDGSGDEAVWLYLREQEVGAVEDPALLDIALGGPDTSERLRIVQRVVRSSTDQADCAGALATLEQSWAEEGLAFDPATMRLDSASALLVSFEEAPAAPTPCEPVAQGGYLGAENQLIRVQVADVDRRGTPTLVWGFDNAYFLYRLTQTNVDNAGGTTTLTLASAPVDSYHQPAKDQAVEVLQAAAELTSSDYIAATTGIVTSCASAYDPDEGTLVISTALDADTLKSPLLFLRVWQDTIVAGGGPVPLGDTGIEVTISSSTGVFHVGDYWQFAVRPGTPTAVSPVYPERILDTPQPPDGPRLWACPLAVIAWADGTPTLTDCRNHFDNLVTLTGRDGGTCCCVDVSVEDVAGGEKLQALIDRYARKGPTTICLQPGTYSLTAPLVIGPDHANLTIEGCSHGVVLQGEGRRTSFLLGLILLDGVTNFTLRGIEVDVPLVRFRIPSSALAGVPTERRQLLAAYGKLLYISIGVYALGGSGLRFENCTFSFGDSANANVFAAGIFGTRAVRGLEIEDCEFMAKESATAPFGQLAQLGEADPPYQVRFGYLQVPTRAAKTTFQLDVLEADTQRLAAESAPPPTLSKRAAVAAAKQEALAASQIGVPSLADAAIVDNLFDGLTVPVLVLGQAGTVRIDDNTVRSCYGGFWLVTTSTTNVLAMIDRVASGSVALWSYLQASQLTALADPVLMFASVVGRVLPLTLDSTQPEGTVGKILAPTAERLGVAEGLFTQLYALQGDDAANVPPAAPAAAAGANAPAAGQAVVTERSAVQAGKALLALPSDIAGVFKQPGVVDVADVVPAVDPGTSLTPRIDVNGNQVDSVISRSDSGAGLLVVALDTTNASSLVCAGNRIRSRVAIGSTVSLWSLVGCALTGNLVSNEIPKGDNHRSVVLRPQLPGGKAATVAVTGNVLLGPAALPPRPLAAPFDTWVGLNTITNYIGP